LAGTFLIVGGGIVSNNMTLSKIDVGSLMIVGGAGMIVPRFIFWVKGANKYRIFLAQEAIGTASLHFMGNGIIYRF